MKIVFFDLETTGTLPNRHGIHQISGEIVIDGETKEKFNFNVCPNPRAEILDEALKIAGVTKEQILAYPEMSVVFKQFTDMLGRYVNKYDKKAKYYLAGFNNSAFDNPFLRGWFLQNGDNYFGSWFWSNSFDLMILATPHLAHKQPDMENFKLATVARHLGIEVIEEKLHDASYDIALTKASYDVIFRGSAT